MIQYFQQKDGKLSIVSQVEGCDWIHLSSPLDATEIKKLSDSLEIPTDFITDSLDIDERSRYEREDDANFILLNTPIANSGKKEYEALFITIPIGIILKEGLTITVTQKENPVITRFMEQKVKGFNPKNQELFVIQMFQYNVFEFLNALKQLNLRRNLMEEELYNSSRNEELKQLLRIEKSLVYFVNSLSSNDLLMMKMKRTDFLKIRDNEEFMDLFEDAIIDNSQALEMSNVYTNILSGTMEAYASIVSNNLNTFIHRLTIVTIILMVPTLVASFYGMNLGHLPLSQHPYSFYFLIAISLIIGFLLIWFFRRDQKIDN